MAKTDDEKIKEVLTRNVEEVFEKDHLEMALKSGKKLRVKLGIDPTGKKLHIGRAVAIWKLREFQDLGHQIVLIIGDFTARVGDPSDKTEKRPMLTREMIGENLKGYLDQIGKILDLKKTEVRYNSEWLEKLTFLETAELAESFSVNQMLHRRAFSERFKKNIDISLREFMYPLMQGYDSVAIKADVELGGTDQLFNLMGGRKIQEHYGQKPQDIMTMGMLWGTDGRKMATSWGNVINITDAPDEQFGKIMAASDDQILNYFRFATRLPEEEIKKYEKELEKGANPKNIKMILGKEIVALYHGEAAAKKAEENWVKLFSKRIASVAGTADLELPEIKLKSKKINPVDLIIESGVVKSKSEARRLVEQGGFSVNDKSHKDPSEELILKSGDVLRVGKKKFFRVA